MIRAVWKLIGVLLLVGLMLLWLRHMRIDVDRTLRSRVIFSDGGTR